MSQWDDERKKFTKDKLKCLIIDSTERLKKTSVKELCEADMIIVPAGIIEEESGKNRPYTEHLANKAGSTDIPPAQRCKYSIWFFVYDVHHDRLA